MSIAAVCFIAWAAVSAGFFGGTCWRSRALRDALGRETQLVAHVDLLERQKHVLAVQLAQAVGHPCQPRDDVEARILAELDWEVSE